MIYSAVYLGLFAIMGWALFTKNITVFLIVLVLLIGLVIYGG